ncbi:MAG: hypothetical protein WKG03_00465 [Telluria sp.]
MSTEFKRYVVELVAFKHDANGNPVAHHTVFGCTTAGDEMELGRELYTTRRRQQVGALNTRHGWAGTALTKAGAPAGLKLTRTLGDRSAGVMHLIYDIPAPVVPNGAFIVYGRKFKTVTFQTDDEANAFMGEHTRWGVIGVAKDGAVHVANCDDKGTQLGPVVHLTCCCCGAATRGRQWHNRDTGYGLGVECIEFCSRNTSPEDFERCYGRRGEHFDVEA